MKLNKYFGHFLSNAFSSALTHKFRSVREINMTYGTVATPDHRAGHFLKL